MSSHGTASTLPRRALAEFIGTALLVAAVIGSGIAAALTAIILAVGPVSGAHLKPAVTLADWHLGGISGYDGVFYGLAQIGGGVSGAVAANMMFALPAVEISSTARWGAHLWFSEVVATFGLLLVIFGGARSGRGAFVPVGVGAYIGGAYWFTSSTSFANPAVTVARTLSNTFAGIAPGSAGPFLTAQVAGALLAVAVVRLLYPTIAEVAASVVVPHTGPTGHPENIGGRSG